MPNGIDEEEKKEEEKPEEEKVVTPTPPEPVEYYPGYQRQYKAFGELYARAEARLTEARRKLSELPPSRVSTRMFWQSQKGGISIPLPFANIHILSKEDFDRQWKDAQAELDAATQEFARMSWRQQMITSLPIILADPDSGVQTVEDVYVWSSTPAGRSPEEFLLEGDKAWLQEAFSNLQYLATRSLPEGYAGSMEDIRAKVLDTILSEPKLELKSVHNLTVDELVKTIRPITVELPEGMSAEDVRTIVSDLGFDEETQADIDSIHTVAEELKRDWQAQAAYLNLIRAGILDVEAPELTPAEFTKMLFTQPAMATFELLDKYFNALSRPLAAAAILAFPRIDKDSSAAELERIYEEYRSQGVGAWEAYSLAFQTWDVNLAYKMFAENALDPTSYLGFGIASKVAITGDKVLLRLLGKSLEASRLGATRASTVAAKATTKIGKVSEFLATPGRVIDAACHGPYLSRFVGAIERGWLELWDVPFRGLRRAIRAIPKTPTQRAISYARQAFMDTRAYLRRFTGKDLVGVTIPEVREAFESAIKQAAERPFETGDLAVRVGKYLTEYDFFEEATIKEWAQLAGGEGAQVTQQMVHDVNNFFDMFYRKTLTSKEAASNILLAIGVDTTAKNVNKLTNTLSREGEKLAKASLDIIKGDSARDVLEGLLRHVEDMQVRKALSPVYKYALKMGKSTGFFNRAGRAIDSLTRNSFLAKIDRMFTAPMANQYLLFTNYGPFNVIESAMRSFLGGGEMLYPRAASPVDELVRIGEGLTNLPYEMVVAQREMGRLEIAVIDPKTNKTLVFNKGKIPGITKDLPFGVSIDIGGKKYPIRSLQQYNDMFADFGTKQRAYYLLTKYKQFLQEIAPDQIDEIARVFDRAQPILDDIKSISKGDKNDFVRVLQQDATVGPDMVRKHDIPLPELERRKALREVNKTLDKCTDIYNPQKQAIRDKILDGSIWKDINGTMNAIKDSVREFNIVSLQNEGAALDRLVADLKDFAPATSDEMLRNIGFISDIVDGISERIGEVRSITQSRAASLTGQEIDDFHRAASETLAGFLGKSKDAVDTMLDGIARNVSRPRTLLDDLTMDIKLAPTKGGAPGEYDIILDGIRVGGLGTHESKKLNSLVIDILGVDKPGILDRQFLRDIDVLANDLAVIKGYNKISIVAKPEHQKLYKAGNYTSTRSEAGYTLYEKSVMKPKPGITLTADQTQRLHSLTDAIKLRHANAVAARDLDRKIINDAVSQTPRRKRNKEFWDWLQQKRSTEAWEPYWAKEETLFNNVEDLKLGMMNSLGVDITEPAVVPQVVDKLAPAHVAYMMGVAGDDMYKALTKVGAMTTIRSKNRFTTWVYRRANKAATKVGKTPEEIGFSREAIGDVYDQMFANVGIDPAFANKEALAPAMMQLDDVEQELTRQYGLKAIPESDYVKFKQYVNQVAEGVESLPMYGPAIGYRGGIPKGKAVYATTGSEATEGTGLYLANTKEMAERFSRAGKGLTTRDVTYSRPKKVLEIGHDETYLMAQDASPLLEPVQETDSVWLKANKRAAEIANLSDTNWDVEVAGANISEILQDQGYDAVRVGRPGDPDGWIVLLDDSLWRGEIKPSVSAEWTSIREDAMKRARTQYEMDFTDYENRNMVDALMRMIYPFWTYEWQRWFWLPRAMLRTPGVGTAIGRYYEYSEQGYIPIPGTDLQFNPLRGTVFMGGFRRLYLRDYPEYYDQFPGMEMIDFLSRMGFYPGAHIMLPIVATGAITGKPEWSEVMPAWSKTVLDAARAISPDKAGAVIDHYVPDRFREYLTMLTLGEMGYDADAIWRKKHTGEKLTEEEEKLWRQAEAKAVGWKGVLMEQTGVFRIRPEEYQDFINKNKELIADMTGVPVEVQDTINNRYPVTGKRLSDYYKLDALQQKVLYNSEMYKRWQGVTTPLYPSQWQQEDIRIREYYEKVSDVYQDYRKNGVYDEQGNLVARSVNEITRLWMSGEIGPDQWRSQRGTLMTQASAAVTELGKRVYPDVPKTLDERAARYEERGLPAPTYSPDQELMYMYYDIKPELKFDWDSQTDEWNFEAYYAKIQALIETLEGEFKQRFLDRIQFDWNAMEKLYWSVSMEYLRPYRLVRNLVLEQYNDEQRQQIERFEVARGAERDELQDIIGPDGEKLISGFASKVREARQRMRMIDPELDAWCYFFGITDTLLSAKSKERYAELEDKYIDNSMAG